MSDYKRLTDKKVKGTTERYIRVDKDYILSAYDIITEEKYEFVDMLLNRLAELEDKIEQSLMLELPCKVGDKFYQVVKGLPIYEWEVETIVFSNIYFPKNYVITARRVKDLAFWKFWSEDFGETVFLTKAEAEKKLEELKEKK